jgi:hypothetical protein
VATGHHAASSTGGGRALELYRFPILRPEEIALFAGRFKGILFDAVSPGDHCEVNPVSGYIHYFKSPANTAPGGQQIANLPQNKAEAERAARRFLASKYERFTRDFELQGHVTRLYGEGKPLRHGFAPIPHPDWLKLVEAYPVKSRRNTRADHWLCKFEVELPLQHGKMPMLNAHVDVRLGGAPVASLPTAYEVVGFVSRFRPMVFAPSGPLAPFLEDTGSPHRAHGAHGAESGGHGHGHGVLFDNPMVICYMLADDNSPQFHLLPYEVTVEGGDHASVLPASKESLWVELQVEKQFGNYVVYALVMGGSGNYEAKWGYWKPFGGMDAEGQVRSTVKSVRGGLEVSPVYAGVATGKLTLPVGVWDVGFSVYDRDHHNILHRVVSLMLNPEGERVSTLQNVVS